MSKQVISGKNLLRSGFRDGIPIGLGYFAVSFSLGITARASGLSAFQGFLTSLLINASAGEYAGFALIAENGTYLEMALVTLVANARYLLMSFALSQRISDKTPLRHRLGIGFYLTDELFGISIARPGTVEPRYTYGAALAAAPCWAIGTALGILVGNLLPEAFAAALGVSLYGMFLAVIIPASKNDRAVLAAVLLGFALSTAAAYAPGIRSLSGGMRTILLTIVISAAAAVICPHSEANSSSGLASDNGEEACNA